MDKKYYNGIVSDEEDMSLVQQSQDQNDTAKRKGVYSNLKRQLSEEDLNSPGTQRLILAELDKYDECKKDLNFYKEAYHRKDKENAVYKQQISNNKAFDVVYSFLLAAGPAILGLSPSVCEKDKTIGVMLIIIGVICLLAGIITKIFVKPSKQVADDER